MTLGLVSAILPDLRLEGVVGFTSAEDFDCVEVMCWSCGRAYRRYAGVTHIDVTEFSGADADRVRDLMGPRDVVISALGYYPTQRNHGTPRRRALHATLHVTPGQVRGIWGLGF